MLHDEKIMKNFGKVLAETITIDNIDLGAAGGVGLFVDSDYAARDLIAMDVFDDY
jgi:hypothetical protein